MKNTINFFGLSLLAAAALAGCGGGGSADGAGAPAAPAVATLSGKVIDGYVANAAVCLDLNRDQICSADEPSATSNADGSFDLSLVGLTIDQIRQASLLTIIGSTSKDADDNGQTIAEAGRSPFRLMAPASVYVEASGATKTAVVSPLTTLIAHEMQGTENASLESAEAFIKRHLNLEHASNPFADYIANPDAALHEKARILAATFGEVTRALMAKNGMLNERDASNQAFQFARENAQKLLDDVRGNLTPSLSMTAVVQNVLSGYGVIPAVDAGSVTGACAASFTLKQFNQITAGMTLAQIDAVVGCAGVLQGNTVVYSTGHGPLGSPLGTISVTLNNGIYEALLVPGEVVVQNGVIKGFSENQKTFIGPFLL